MVWEQRQQRARMQGRRTIRLDRHAQPALAHVDARNKRDDGTALGPMLGQANRLSDWHQDLVSG